MFAKVLKRNRPDSLGCYRIVLMSMAMLAVFLMVSSQAAAIPRGNAMIVVDAHTGEVLAAKRSQTRWHPASLTKMMTLYQLFDALQRGKVSLNTRIRLSRRAAGQPPSKLGLGRGGSIRVRDAISALAVKSANDIAVAVAEHLAGSESKFASRMTRTARKLGMRRTTFRNASGLHHSRQVTTARDMAILSIALMRDFPQYYRYFGQKTFRYGKRTYRSSNRMLNTYSGMDGIKTGYIFKSGFNLAASAKRGERRVVAVVLGGNNTAERTRLMKSALDGGFKRLKKSRRKAVARRLPIHLNAPPPIPRPRPGFRTVVRPALIAAADRSPAFQPIVRPNAPLPRLRPVASFQVASAGIAVPGAPVPRPPIARVVAGRLAGVSAAPLPSAPPKAVSRNRAVNPGRFGVQVGAYRSSRDASRQLSRVIKRLPTKVGDPNPHVETFDTSNNGRFYRARLIGFDNRSEAEKTCDWLKVHRTKCMIVTN